MGFLRDKKVSVVIPNYNYARYMKGRIRSVLKQTYPIYELIVLDDCSSDESVKVILEELEKAKKFSPDLKIKFIKNRQNSGKAMKQWLKGVEAASGDYVWIAEADDSSKPRFLEEVMKAFDDDGVVISYAESAIINDFGWVIAPNFRWSRDKEKTGHYKRNYVKSGKDEIGEIFAIRCAIPNVSAVVFRKNDILLEALRAALKYTQVGDWYLYIEVLKNGKIAYNRKSLNKFRIHAGSVTRSVEKEKHYREVEVMHDVILREMEVPEKTKKLMLGERKRLENKLKE